MVSIVPQSHSEHCSQFYTIFLYNLDPADDATAHKSSDIVTGNLAFSNCNLKDEELSPTCVQHNSDDVLTGVEGNLILTQARGCQVLILFIPKFICCRGWETV